ncbi:MAG: cytochrome c peroxidase [Bacteroidota bacterium]
MTRSKRITVILLMAITALTIGCQKEQEYLPGFDEDVDVDMDVDIDVNAFSEEDMRILQNSLNISSNPYNYAELSLPSHFTDGELDPMDNMPDDNLTTNMGATLGRVLFYDKNLSKNNTIACASCHQQKHSFSDPNQFSSGLYGGHTTRNSMNLINTRYYQTGRFAWDERAASLEDMVLLPIQDPIEMNMDLKDLEDKLRQIEYYPILFRYAFGNEEVTTNRIANALAQYIRSIVSYNTKFDEGMRLTGNPFVAEGIPLFPNYTPLEKEGQQIFFSGTEHQANCLYCHGGPAMTVPEGEDDMAKNNGLDLIYTDKGKGSITLLSDDNAKFKVPSLRNIEFTAPYMHDGRFKTLEEVIDHYSEGVVQHSNLHFRLSTVDDGPPGGPPKKLFLSQYEKDALIAFLKTLSDEDIITDKKYSNPFKGQ